MADEARARKQPFAEGTGPREIEPSSADPRSTERELEEIAFKHTGQGGELQSGTADGFAPIRSERLETRPASGDLVSEAEAGVVLWMFQAVNAGETLGQIARRLNDQGVPSRWGIKWGG